MKNKKPSLKELAALCAELGPEDGLHPREFAKSRALEHSKSGYKDEQLSKQVERALNLELAVLGEDPVLRYLVVSHVDPDPDASHLLVLVVPGTDTAPIEDAEAVAALERISGRLRCAVAGAIHRKRTPELSYRFLGSGSALEEDGHA